MLSSDFDFQPTLIGEVLWLRPLVADDFAALHAAASDPLIWEQHPARDRWQLPDFRHFFAEALRSRGALVAIDRANLEVIGTSCYLGHEIRESEVEIGFTFLRRTCWGGRYNSEMKALMLRHAFRYVTRVVFLIAPDNHRSQCAIERLGARRLADRIDRKGALRWCYECDRKSWAYKLSSRAKSSVSSP